MPSGSKQNPASSSKPSTAWSTSTVGNINSATRSPVHRLRAALNPFSRGGKTRPPQPEDNRLPSELLAKILSFVDANDVLGSASQLLAPCLVCLSWYDVASELLYGRIELGSYTSHLLLLRTLKSNTLLSSRVRTLILPLISTYDVEPYGSHRLRLGDVAKWKRMVYDGGGDGRLQQYENLSLHESDYDRPSKDFRQILDALPRLGELHMSSLPTSTYIAAPLSKLPFAASLRRLVLLGCNTMRIFLEEALHGAGFESIESITFLEFNAHRTGVDKLLQHAPKTRRLRLKSLRLERGVVSSSTFTLLVSAMQNSLKSLTIIGVRSASDGGEKPWELSDHALDILRNLEHIHMDIATLQKFNYATFASVQSVTVSLNRNGISLPPGVDKASHLFSPRNLRDSCLSEKESAMLNSLAECVSRSFPSLKRMLLSLQVPNRLDDHPVPISTLSVASYLPFHCQIELV